MKKVITVALIVLLCLVVICGAAAAVLYFNNFYIEMTLSGDKNITLEYGEKYTELGAKSELKGRFIFKKGKHLDVVTNGTVDDDKLGTYTVKYTSDLPRRHAELTRTVTVVDTVCPTLTLKGKDKITLTQGNKYDEAGFSAADNYDGDITDNVTVDGSVDTSKVGEYTLTYNIKDSSGNTASASRTVTVKAPPAPKPTVKLPTTVYPGDKTVYLTFDDGAGKYTAKLLDVLKKYNVKATFFVINTGYNGLLSRMAKEGHSIGIHTATHNYKSIYSSETAFFAEIEKMQTIIEAQTGNRSKLIRFPGGSSNRVSSFNPGIMTRLVSAVTQKGYRYFDWNVDSKDAGGATTKEQIITNVTNGIAKRSVSVVLQHDIKGFSVDAVEEIIKWGLANGYTFKALDTTSPICHHNVNN